MRKILCGIAALCLMVHVSHAEQGTVTQTHSGHQGNCYAVAVHPTGGGKDTIYAVMFTSKSLSDLFVSAGDRDELRDAYNAGEIVGFNLDPTVSVGSCGINNVVATSAVRAVNRPPLPGQ